MAEPRTLVLKNIDIEGPGLLGDWLAEEGFPLEILEPEEIRADLDLDSFEALVVLGGPMNVDEEQKHPFLKVEKELIRHARDAGKAVLGLCLGHQLIASALGGRVNPNPRKEIGVLPIFLTPAGLDDPLFDGVPPTLDSFQWHGDVAIPPDGALILAESPWCPIQALRFGPKVYGLQFHLEVTPAIAATWFEAYREQAKREGIDPRIAVDILDARLHEIRANAGRLFENFYNLL